MSTTGYTPKYGSPDEIPLTGPGSPGTPDDISHDFTLVEKQRALRIAETRLEADVNGGVEITTPTDTHRVASEAFASYVLTFGPESPQSIRSGEFADAGEARNAYSEKYKQMYDGFINSLTGGDTDGGGDGGTDGGGTGGITDTSVGFEVF